MRERTAKEMKRLHRLLVIIVGAGLLFGITPKAEAACGAVTCFVVIGSQQQVPQEGLLTFNTIYNYTPMRLLSGTSGLIPAIDQTQRRLILDHHQETRTITNQLNFDLNYGITDKLGVEITVPYMWRTHKHIDGIGEDGDNGNGESVTFGSNNVGDMRVGLKYNVLPTLRSLVVLGLGVYLPTGSTKTRDSNGEVMEAPTQLGRGQVGLNPTLYQTYEVIPHRLNQFSFAGYRHTFRNNDGYQFGDEYNLGLGANLVTVPWLVLTGQFNGRYLVHDNMSASLEQSAPPGNGGGVEPAVIDPLIANRRVPNTGSTYLAFAPGFQVNVDGLVDSVWTKFTSFYFYAQIPVARDFNNNLAQGTSFVFGLTRSFQLLRSS